jgi:hypothetical protein
MSEYWKETIKQYEDFISYPKMDVKLLQRPPFKYILAIFLELEKKTGFT